MNAFCHISVFQVFDVMGDNKETAVVRHDEGMNDLNSFFTKTYITHLHLSLELMLAVGLWEKEIKTGRRRTRTHTGEGLLY